MASSPKGSQNDLKILIIGKGGSGKSTLANLILGNDAFGTQSGMEMKTKGAQTETMYFPALLRDIRVVDTPDIECFSNNPRTEEENINVWKAATEFDPDAILYTVRSDDKYEGPTHEKYKRIKTLWGSDFCKKLIVAFTFGDKSVRDIQQDIASAGQHLKNVVADADQRYLLFGSNYPRADQVKNLVNMILEMRPSSASGAAPLLRPPRMDTSHTHDERKLSVVIIGRTKTGKTKLGSVIAGNHLNTSNYDATSTTARIGNTKITVVDTPDLIDKKLGAGRQVPKWKELSGSEPDVILLAVRFDRKYMAQDLQLYKTIKKTWGEDDFKRRLAVVFTFVEKTPEDILKKLGREFEEVLADVNQRYVFFDHKTAEVGNHIVQFMVRIMESLSSFGAAAMPSRDVAMNAIGTTRTHGHRGHSTMDEYRAVQSPRKDLSILVIGKAGTGKSSIANAMLQKREFGVAVGMTVQTKTAAEGSVFLDDMNIKECIFFSSFFSTCFAEISRLSTSHQNHLFFERASNKKENDI
ncbi:GTPase IMAP family member 8-like isoform X2 [Littorina saxatilis]